MPVFNRTWFDPATGNPNPADLLTRGPGLQVEVSIPNVLAGALLARSRPLPTPHLGTALIDTGASVSAVDISILRGLGLNPVGTIPVTTPAGVETQGIYVVRLAFPGTPIEPQDPRPVIGSQLFDFGHVALLCRDLLQGALLIYDGVHGYWTIAF